LALISNAETGFTRALSLAVSAPVLSPTVTSESEQT
jgi:hypothetical protein